MSDGKTCASCSYWGKQSNGLYSEALTSVRLCSYAEPLWEAREWRQNEHGEIRDVLVSDRLAFVQDGSDYAAEFYTKPEFGCNQWRAA